MTEFITIPPDDITLIDRVLVVVYPTRWSIYKRDYLSQLRTIQHYGEPIHCLHFCARKADIHSYLGLQTEPITAYIEGIYTEDQISRNALAHAEAGAGQQTPSHMVSYARSALGRGTNLPEFSLVSVDVETHPPKIAASILGPISTHPDPSTARQKWNDACAEARITAAVQPAGRILRLRKDEGTYESRRVIVLHNWCSKRIAGPTRIHGVEHNELNAILQGLKGSTHNLQFVVADEPEDILEAARMFLEQGKSFTSGSIVRRAKVHRVVQRLVELKQQGKSWSHAARHVKALRDLTASERTEIKRRYQL